MDMPSASMINSNNAVLQQFGIAMLGKELNISENQAAAEVAMIDSMPAPAPVNTPSLESLVNPDIGGNIDIGV